MKIVRRGALPVGGDSGLDDVRRARARGLRAGRAPRRGDRARRLARLRRQGALLRRRRRDPAAQGRDRRRERHGRARCSPRCSSACRSSTWSPATSSPTAPSRTTSRTRSSPRTARSSMERTRAESADLGVAYDGDADRCFFVDDTGEFVPGDFVTALLAEAVLEKEPGAKVIYDVRASWAVPRAIEAAGGVALVNRVGHAFIKHRMRKDERRLRGRGVRALLLPRLLAGRHRAWCRSCSCWSCSRSAARPLSELLAPYRERYFITGEINTPGRRRAAQAAGDQGALRGAGRPDLPPRRHLGRLRRLALQRAPVEHRAAAAAEPRGARREARWSARRDEVLALIQSLGLAGHRRRLRAAWRRVHERDADEVADREDPDRVAAVHHRAGAGSRRGSSAPRRARPSPSTRSSPARASCASRRGRRDRSLRRPRAARRAR